MGSSIAARFAADRRASMIVAFGLVLPVLAVAAGATVEYGNLTLQRARLQKAVDYAAVAAAQELSLANADDRSVASTARGRVREGMRSYAQERALAVESAVVGDRRSVDVDAVLTVEGIMATILSWPRGTVTARATGTLVGQARLCILALVPSGPDAVRVERASRIDAPACSVYSNSTASAGLTVLDTSRVAAESACSAGGYLGGPLQNFARSPRTGCPALPDPLAARSPPPIGPCLRNGYQVHGETVTIQPGLYCGGVKFDKGATVTMAPGVYAIQDGQFDIDSGASIQGDNVGVYLKGDARIAIGRDTTVSLSAPKSGPMAGLLFFHDRASTGNVEHFVSSGNARRLLGTIYLPQSTLRIDADKPVADQSAYTVIVARRLQLRDGPSLVMNAMYAQSDVPVPEGLGDRGSRVSLSR